MKIYVVVCSYVDDYGLNPYNQVKVCKTKQESVQEVQNFFDDQIIDFIEPDYNFSDDKTYFEITEADEDRDRQVCCTCSVNEFDV